LGKALTFFEKGEETRIKKKNECRKESRRQQVRVNEAAAAAAAVATALRGGPV
jgi:hypothetical protein